jgi:hypothetical protein
VRHDVTVWVPLWLVRTVFACFALFGDVLPSLQDWRTPEKGAHSRMPRAPPPPPPARTLCLRVRVKTMVWIIIRTD